MSGALSLTYVSTYYIWFLLNDINFHLKKSFEMFTQGHRHKRHTEFNFRLYHFFFFVLLTLAGSKGVQRCPAYVDWKRGHPAVSYGFGWKRGHPAVSYGFGWKRGRLAVSYGFGWKRGRPAVSYGHILPFYSMSKI